MVRRDEAWTLLERNELEVFLLALCLVAGLSGLLGLNRSASAALLPTWLMVSWYLLLTLGGAAAIAGVYWRDPLDGLLIERAALWPIGSGAAMYSVALADAAQWVAATLTLLFALAAIRRAVHIPRMLRRIRFLQPLEQPGQGAA